MQIISRGKCLAHYCTLLLFCRVMSVLFLVIIAERGVIFSFFPMTSPKMAISFVKKALRNIYNITAMFIEIL